MGGLEAILGGLGAVLGRLEEVLRQSWVVLGRSWAVLRRSWGTKMAPKSIPKTTSKFKSEKVASWDRLGSILDRFGGCPGGIFIDFLLVFVLFRGNRRFRYQTGPKTVFGRKLARLEKHCFMRVHVRARVLAFFSTLFSRLTRVRTCTRTGTKSGG